MYGLVNVVTEAFDPDATPELASRQNVTLAGSATFFQMAYLNAQRGKGQSAPPIFPDLRNCPGGGAPKPPQLHFDIKAELGGAGIVSGWASPRRRSSPWPATATPMTSWPTPRAGPCRACCCGPSPSTAAWPARARKESCEPRRRR